MKDIRGYEGLYGITMTGRVWSYKTKRFLKPGTTTGGYQIVVLCKDSKCKTFRLHRLVAETYLPNPDNKPHVGHIDDNPKNNCWDNLYWTNALNNNNYGSHSKSCKGAKKVICVETGQIFRTISEAEVEMNLKGNHISEVCHGKRKTTGGYTFKFVQESDS